MSPHVPAGGPSTINGVLYQMLWSLFRTADLHVATYRVDAQTGAPTSAFLRLEPIGGGGDLREIGTSRTLVDQVKSRPDNSTWSLKETVEEVFPDLYRAVDIDDDGVCYRVVTEGRMGRWGRAYDFFRSLRGRSYDPSALDDGAAIFFPAKTGSGPMWQSDAYAEVALFEAICESMRCLSGIADSESPDDTRRKLWHLLAHFEFVGGRTQSSLQREIDDVLLALVDHDHDVATRRDAMLLDLARRATSGDTTIHMADFMRDHGLDSVPWTQWGALCARSEALLVRSLERRKYFPSKDVRYDAAREAIAQWPMNVPLLLIVGETGQGKSWCLYAAVHAISHHPHLVALTEATGSFDEDTRRAVEDCRLIRNADQGLPLDRVAARLRALSCFPKEGPWLTLAIDGVQDLNEARQLALAPWEQWGVRAIVSCHKEVADWITENAPSERCQTLAVSDFAVGELHAYLNQAMGNRWTVLPGDVRNALRRPLLASIFSEEIGSQGDWLPVREYEFYDAMWRRLASGSQLPFPQDASGLKTLALSVLDGKPYPWPAESTAGAGLSNDAVVRLCSTGWLRRTDRGCFEVPHDRLLNWAVAEALVTAHVQGQMDHVKFLDTLRFIYHGERTYSGRALGYVPMDVVWILTCRDADNCGTVEEIVDVLQPPPSHESGLFYSHLLSTVGPRMALPLISRLRKISDGDSLVVSQIISGITALGSQDLPEQASALLMDDSPRIQRAAMSLLGDAPIAKALDRLWVLHTVAEKDPAPFLSTHEHASAVYRDSMRALTACLTQDPSWIERAIRTANPMSEPVHDLAYLLADIDQGQALWQTCKPHLVKKVPVAKERSLARCIYRHRDESELAWLEARVDRHDDLVGAACLQAIAAIDPDRAVANLTRLSVGDLVLTRGWAVRELLLRCPGNTTRALLKVIRESHHPWNVAMVYQGSENAMDVPTLEYLLDQLEQSLQQVQQMSLPANKHPLWGPLSLLASIHDVDLLQCFERRRNKCCETLLTAWMLARNPRSSGCADVEGEHGLAVLYRIGGKGFTEVVNALLGSHSQYGRLDGIEESFKRHDVDTTELLKGITLQDQLWDRAFPLEQEKATRALAIYCDWRSATESVRKWGLKTSRDVAHAIYQARLDGKLTELLTSARDMLHEATPLSSADIFLLGLLGIEEARIRLRLILSREDPTSEVALACVLALGYLKDGDEKTVELLAQQVGHHRFAAVNALLRIGTLPALRALTADVNRRRDIEYVMPLLSHEETRQDAVSVLQGLLQESRGFDLAMKLPLVGSGVSEEVLAMVCADRSLQERIREAAFVDEGSVWVGGSKAAAISCLATFDRHTAFVAAETCLRNGHAHDRPRYAGLLMTIDSTRASEVIIMQAGREESAEVRRSLGRALGRYDAIERLSRCVSAGDATARMAACHLLPWQQARDSARDLLQRMVSDRCEAVAEAAMYGLERVSRTRRAEALLAAMESRTIGDRWWILLDSAIALADPGDEHGQRPEWAQRVCDRAPYLVRAYIDEGLERRRKDIIKEK